MLLANGKSLVSIPTELGKVGAETSISKTDQETESLLPRLKFEDMRVAIRFRSSSPRGFRRLATSRQVPAHETTEEGKSNSAVLWRGAARAGRRRMPSFEDAAARVRAGGSVVFGRVCRSCRGTRAELR